MFKNLWFFRKQPEISFKRQLCLNKLHTFLYIKIEKGFKYITQLRIVGNETLPCFFLLTYVSVKI